MITKFNIFIKESLNGYNFENFIKGICQENNLSFDDVKDSTSILNEQDWVFDSDVLKNRIIDGNKIEIARVISIPKEYVLDGSFLKNNLREDNFGICWTWLSEGIPIYGRFGDDGVFYTPENNPNYYINFKSIVNFSDVDWVETLKMNLQSPEEFEITLKDGVEITLTKYWLYYDVGSSSDDEFTEKNLNKEVNINIKVKA